MVISQEHRVKSEETQIYQSLKHLGDSYNTEKNHDSAQYENFKSGLNFKENLEFSIVERSISLEFLWHM